MLIKIRENSNEKEIRVEANEEGRKCYCSKDCWYYREWETGASCDVVCDEIGFTKTGKPMRDLECRRAIVICEEDNLKHHLYDKSATNDDDDGFVSAYDLGVKLFKELSEKRKEKNGSKIPDENDLAAVEEWRQAMAKKKGLSKGKVFGDNNV